jgi:hypothetical protein
VAKLRTRRPQLDPAIFIAAAEASAQPASPPAAKPASVHPASRQTKTRGQGRGDDRPWTRPDVREDVTKPFNLRLPEPVKLKLDFIRRETRISVHEFIMTSLLPAVEAEIERLQREGR